MKIFINPWKSLLIFIIIVIFFETTGSYFLTYKIILPTFSHLEREKAVKDLNRIKNSIQREVFHLTQISKDWAIWDDTYKYVKNKNRAYEESNFQWPSLNESGIELIFICSSTGKTIWHGIHDKISNKDIILKRFSEKFCSSDSLIDLFKKKGELSGLISTENGALLITLQKILRSSGKGSSRGVLVMGRFLHKTIVKHLSSQLKINFDLENLQSGSLSGTSLKIINNLKGKSYFFNDENNDILKGYAIIKDIYNKPLLLIRANFMRDIMERGFQTANLVNLSVLITFAIIFSFILVWIVLFRAETNRRRKKIERIVREKTRQLHESEERLRTLINATPDIICFKDGVGRWIEANKADLELFHLENVDYKGKTDIELAELTHPIFKEAFINCYESDKLSWKKKKLNRTEEEIPTIEGGNKIFDVIKIPLFNTDGSRKGLIVFGRDITQEKILSRKLLKAEKMEAIGLMAGGVAHDLNNILSGIIGYPELILIKLPQKSKIRKYVEAIKKSGERASEIVMDLLTIARGVNAKKEVFNLNNIVKEYFESAEYKKITEEFKKVSIECNMEKNLLNFLCSPVHIKKCIMNMVNNAAEAIKGKGKIVVSTRNEYINENISGTSSLKKGEYVVLSISDSGEGIPEKDLEHIFEPFFSKKTMGQKSGTGLGLAIVWNTVHDHEGKIKVTSTNKGTTFELFFPAVRTKFSKRKEIMEFSNLKGKGEKILIVDDDAEQLEICSNMLEILEYQVYSVGSGESAVDFIKNNNVDLIISDLSMEPGINGFETLERIFKLKPNQKAIIMSGYYSQDNIDKANSIGAIEFLKKPLTLKKLGLAIKRALLNS